MTTATKDQPSKNSSPNEPPAVQVPAVVAKPADIVRLDMTTVDGFVGMQRAALALCSSTLVPESYRGKDNLGNCIIALEIASRLGCSALAVMQNLYVVHGKPGWSATFIIGAINSTGKFSPLRFERTGAGDARQCVCWAKDLRNGDSLESPPVTIGMAKAEGWYGKNGSKWKTMSELMLMYRAATLFGRLYAPEVLLGLRTQDEIEDIGPAAYGVQEPPPNASQSQPDRTSEPADALEGEQSADPTTAPCPACGSRQECDCLTGNVTTTDTPKTDDDGESITTEQRAEIVAEVRGLGIDEKQVARMAKDKGSRRGIDGLTRNQADLLLIEMRELRQPGA